MSPSRPERRFPWVPAALLALGLSGVAACAPKPPDPERATATPAELPADPSPPPPLQPPRELAPGQAVELQLEGGDRETFRLELAAGDYVDLAVVQEGADVEARLLDPAGEELLRVDGLTGAFGPERIEWLAETPGSFRLEVEALDTVGESGRCHVELRQQRSATATDRQRAAAARAFFEGEQARDAGQLEAAIRRYGEALDHWRQLGDREQQAATLHRLGLSHRREPSHLDAATNSFHEALELAENDAALEASIHNSLGRTYYDRGDMEHALEHLLQSFRQREAIGDLKGLTITAGTLGPTYAALGEVYQALTFYDHALQGYGRLDDHLNEAKTLHNRGYLYLSQNKPREALDEFQLALAIRERLGNDDAGSTKIGIAQAYILLEELDEARRHLTEALPLLRDVRKATILADLGWVHQLEDENERALELYGQALAIYREHDQRHWEAFVLRRLGSLHAARGDFEHALEDLDSSLRLCRQAGDRDCEAATLYRLAEAERRQGSLEGARAHIREALDLLEELRTRPVGPDMRASYFERKQSFYDLYVDLLMALERRQPGAGHVAEALSVSERSRARSLLEALVEGGIELEDDRRPDLRRRERHLEWSIHVHEGRRAELLEKGAPRAEIDRATRELRALLKQYRRLRDEIRQASPAYAALTQVHPASAAEIQRHVLDDETLLLEIDLGEERSYLWAVDRASIEAFELPGRAAVESLARQAYERATVSHKRRYRAAAAGSLAELSDMLLEPVAGRLAGKRRLLIVGEDVLQYVPFAALPRPGDGSGPRAPLVESHEIVTMPSASALLVLDRRFGERPRAPETLAVLADPVFSPTDPRLAGSGSATPAAATRGRPAAEKRFRRLLFSRQEAERILALVPPAESFQALDFDASAETATSGALGRYRIVHFATHGHLDAEFPELSGLVLSRVDRAGRRRDGSLRLHQIYELDLSAELVVLSACQTALGKEIRGEGLVGLTQGFMYAGAERVLVSLWNVDDRATAELMARFYGHLLQDGMAPAAALRAAQISIRRVERWQAPYYWAGFVLQGPWRGRLDDGSAD